MWNQILGYKLLQMFKAKYSYILLIIYTLL